MKVRTVGKVEHRSRSILGQASDPRLGLRGLPLGGRLAAAQGPEREPVTLPPRPPNNGEYSIPLGPIATGVGLSLVAIGAYIFTREPAQDEFDPPNFRAIGTALFVTGGVFASAGAHPSCFCLGSTSASWA